VLVIHFGTSMSQNDCARRQPVCPGSPCVRGATPTSRSLDAGFAPLPQWLDGVSDALAYGLRGSGTSWTLWSTTTPPPLRPYARAYRGLRALASLSMARSVGGCSGGTMENRDRGWSFRPTYTTVQNARVQFWRARSPRMRNPRPIGFPWIYHQATPNGAPG
jgi:hypothetical protein